MRKNTNLEFAEELAGLPTLNEIKTWSPEVVRAQYEQELARHRETLDKQGYYDGLSRHYRLAYMRDLLNAASPKSDHIDVQDAIGIVLHLARQAAQTDQDRIACDVIDDFAVNHLGDD